MVDAKLRKPWPVCSPSNPNIEIDTSLPEVRVATVLQRLAEMSGLPRSITVDNGPEFAGRALDAWAYQAGVKLSFLRPGKPVENAYIESFDGKFRDECLNEHWFLSLQQASWSTTTSIAPSSFTCLTRL